MRKNLRLASAVVIVTSILAGEASALCVNQSQRPALTMRVMQTELMVAALTCGYQQSYNKFVRKYEGELVSHGKKLRRFFDVAYGRQGQRKLDGFVTRLANETSQRSLNDRASYCPAVGKLFSTVMQTAQQNLWRLANELPFSNAHGIPTCEVRMADRDELNVTPP